MFGRFYAVLLIFSSFLLPRAWASGDPDTNFRERCRRTVSGQYSSLVADMAMSDDSVTLANDARKKSLKQIDSDEIKMKALRKKLEASEYSPELLSERDMLAAQLKLYHEQLASSEGQIESAKKRQATTKKRIDSARKKVESIFKVNLVPDPEGGPRPLIGQIEWKSPCPKYRALCPLPVKDAAVLVALLDEIDDSDLSCHHYAKIK